MSKTKKQKPAVKISVDTERKCKRCGNGGATQSGICIRCISGESNRQPSLPNAEPALDAVGAAAKRFQRVISDLAELADEKTKAEAELIEALRAANRRSLRLGTLTLTLTHKDAVDRISVKKS